MDVHKVQIILEGSIHIDYIDQIASLQKYNYIYYRSYCKNIQGK